MPIYEYQCQACGKKTELLQKMSDPPLATCPQCGGEVKKLISSPAIQFKGTGWYVTDYKKSGGGAGGGAKSGEGGKSECGGETKAAEKSSSSSDSAGASGGSTETKAAKAAGSD